MAYQVLRLNDKELELGKRKYPFINYDQITMFADGMISMSNLDLLIYSLKADISSFSEEEKEIASSIMEKAKYLKEHHGRNRLDGIDIDAYCNMADQISLRAIDTEINNELFRIDQIINFIRTIGKQLSENNMFKKTYMIIGIKFGTIMLEKRLVSAGYDWNYVEEYDHPVICNNKGLFKCDPISFIKEKLSIESSTLDNLGTCSDFYYALVETIDKDQ